MLTILSHFIFWPALVFNLIFWGITIQVLFFEPGSTRITLKDITLMMFVLALMFVPGIYLFGIW